MTTDQLRAGVAHAIELGRQLDEAAALLTFVAKL